MEDLRNCKKCELSYSLSAFVFNKGRPTNTCKKCRAAYQSKYRKIHSSTIKEQQVQWYSLNRESVIAKLKIRQIERYAANDVTFKIARCLRTRLYIAIKGNKSSVKTLELLGCSLSDLRAHLESQFLSGMTWENQGQWHIDHKLPLAMFDLLDPNQIAQAFHYSNLQPLWALDNLKKGARHV